MAEQRIYLKEWRKFRRLTPAAVVARLELVDDPLLPATEASLSRYENAKQPYNSRILAALADIYDCRPHELIGHNPFKEGEIIDLLSKMDERGHAQARAVIEALAKERA